MNLATRIALRVEEQLVPSANDGESDLIGFVVWDRLKLTFRIVIETAGNVT